ncbi:YfbM family protein [Actinomadura atramentaria]|uniref:YfbM family protein n=1 Tax=Actinomadura atramentaria TaxID=1990 RepID=UPI001F0A78D7|nr:YfbM family protein [Actinomadura atramentaria]
MSYLRVPPVLDGESDPGAVARLLFGPARRRAAAPAGCALDLGGAWQALHYLLTGDPWDGPQPEGDVVCGGRLLTEDGADELGLDVIYLDPGRVGPIAGYLAAAPFERVAGRFDLTAMKAAEVQDADAFDDGVLDRVLRPAHAALADFFARAAAEGQAVYKVMAER